MRRALVIGLALLSGCATVGPNYERPKVALPEKYPAGIPAEPNLPADWWKLYGDAALDSLIASAEKTNSDIALAAGRVREAQGVLRETAGAAYPEIDAGYSATRNKVSNRTIPFIPGVPLTRNQHQLIAQTNFEVDFWGRYSRATEAARANLLASRFSQEVVRLGVAAATAQAYFMLRSFDAQVAVLDSTIGVARDSLAIAQARLKAGLASELDVDQAQGALSDALVQHREAVRNRQLVVHQLGVLTGNLGLSLPREKLAGDLFSLPVPPTPPAGLPSALLDRRPDIRSSEETLVAANAQIGVARAALFPTITLTGALGSQSAQLSDLLATGSSIWTLGFGLALPIFDAGRRQARVEEADARRAQALASYQRSIETGFREVADALVDLEATRAEENDLRTSLEAARNALSLSRTRYESGYAPYLEVLDAQRTANQAELAFVRNREARLSFSVDLMKALGGGWQP